MTEGVAASDAGTAESPTAGLRSAVRTIWNADRAAVLVLAVTGVAYSLLWGGITRTGDDSDSYRISGRIMFSGWDRLTDRTPGYPVMLKLLGAGTHENSALFFTQLAMHTASVLMVLGMARALKVPARWRLALVVFLVLPPGEVKVVMAMTETVTEVLICLTAWSFLRWYQRRKAVDLWVCGLAMALSAMVRPTFALLFIPVALVVARLTISGRAWARTRTAIVVAVPSLVMVGGLILMNAVRFDSPGLTPMLPWHLSSRVAMYVERLPKSDEPARSILIRTRDRLLLTTPDHEPKAFGFDASDELARATHKSGRALDRYMLSLDLKLIIHHPFDYADSVEYGLQRYVQLDAEPRLPTGPAVVGYGYNAAQILLILAFAFQAAVVTALAWLRRLDPTVGVVMVMGALISLYCAAVSAGVEVGSARLRTPTDPLLALMLVTGLWLTASVRPRRPARASVSADPTGQPPSTGSD